MLCHKKGREKSIIAAVKDFLAQSNSSKHQIALVWPIKLLLKKYFKDAEDNRAYCWQLTQPNYVRLSESKSKATKRVYNNV
jgi:hypothetical protein